MYQGKAQSAEATRARGLVAADFTAAAPAGSSHAGSAERSCCFHPPPPSPRQFDRAPHCSAARVQAERPAPPRSESEPAASHPRRRTACWTCAGDVPPRWLPASAARSCSRSSRRSSWWSSSVPSTARRSEPFIRIRSCSATISSTRRSSTGNAAFRRGKSETSSLAMCVSSSPSRNCRSVPAWLSIGSVGCIPAVTLRETADAVASKYCRHKSCSAIKTLMAAGISSLTTRPSLSVLGTRRLPGDLHDVGCSTAFLTRTLGSR